MNLWQRAVVHLARWLLSVTGCGKHYRVESVHGAKVWRIHQLAASDEWRRIARQERATAVMLAEQLGQARYELMRAHAKLKEKEETRHA